VRPLSFGPATRFDPNVAPHHHAICDACGSVRDVPASGARERVPREVMEGFAANRVERIYRGLCAACRDAAEDEKDPRPEEPGTRRKHG